MRLYTESETGKILRVSERTLRWREIGVGPAFIRLSPGGGIRYSDAAIQQHNLRQRRRRGGPRSAPPRCFPSPEALSMPVQVLCSACGKSVPDGHIARTYSYPWRRAALAPALAISFDERDRKRLRTNAPSQSWRPGRLIFHTPATPAPPLPDRAGWTNFLAEDALN